MGQSMNTAGDFYWVDCRRGGVWGCAIGVGWLVLADAISISCSHHINRN